MSSSSGKHNGHNMPEKSEAARMIAKLLASRPTPLTEIPHLIENVERALSCLHGKAAVDSPSRLREIPAQESDVTAEERKPRRRRALDHRQMDEPTAIHSDTAPHSAEGEAAPLAPSADTDEIKPTQPILVRRAEVVHVAPAPAPAPTFAPANAAIRGVVQWFDTRTGRGTLRLQGRSNDLPVETETLAAFGLTRLFKGQEIEAQLSGGDEAPKLTGLRLLNHGPAAPVSGGVVRDRHAKQVVVELKRQALSRTAARAEAELLLPSRRAR